MKTFGELQSALKSEFMSYKHIMDEWADRVSNENQSICRKVLYRLHRKEKLTQLEMIELGSSLDKSKDRWTTLLEQQRTELNAIYDTLLRAQGDSFREVEEVANKYEEALGNR